MSSRFTKFDSKSNKSAVNQLTTYIPQCLNQLRKFAEEPAMVVHQAKMRSHTIAQWSPVISCRFSVFSTTHFWTIVKYVRCQKFLVLFSLKKKIWTQHIMEPFFYCCRDSLCCFCQKGVPSRISSRKKAAKVTTSAQTEASLRPHSTFHTPLVLGSTLPVLVVIRISPPRRLTSSSSSAGPAAVRRSGE